ADAPASAHPTADRHRTPAPPRGLAGEHDTVTGPDRAREIAAGISGAVLATVPGAGHLANQEQPALVNDWLRRTALAAGANPPRTPTSPSHP
ncbi:3-oxoadipate enol-lactonase, partial [Streptomyces sp. NPDC059477]